MTERATGSNRCLGGFGRTPRWLLNDPTVSYGAKAFFCLLDDRSNRSGWSWWKEQALADALGVTTRTIRRWARELERVVAITTLPRRGSNLWKVHLDPDIRIRTRERHTRTSVSGSPDISGRTARTPVAAHEAEPQKQNQQAAGTDHDEALDLAYAEVARRIANGTIVHDPDAYARKIASEDRGRLIADAKRQQADRYTTAGQAPPADPSTCKHVYADWEGLWHCVQCGTEWPIRTTESTDSPDSD